MSDLEDDGLSPEERRMKKEIEALKEDLEASKDELNDVEYQLSEKDDEICVLEKTVESLYEQLNSRIGIDRLFDLMREPESFVRARFQNTEGLDLRDYLIGQLSSYKGAGRWKS